MSNIKHNDFKCAYRIETRKVADSAYPYGGNSLRNRADVAKFMRCIENSDQEKLLALYLDTRRHLVGVSVYLGDSTGATVSPRDLVKCAILLNVSNVILVHNHPSGSSIPSSNDIVFKNSCQRAFELFGITLDNCLIISQGGQYESF